MLGVGLNGKMNELSAAVGLGLLPTIEANRKARAAIDRKYRQAASEIAGLSSPSPREAHQSNFGYFPILVDSDYPVSVIELRKALQVQGIHARRYFYPLVSQFEAYRELPSAISENLRNATLLADRVLCLPIYASLPGETQDRIISVLQEPERFLP